MKTIALCMDKDGGLSFFGKRQSTDREVRAKLLQMTDKLLVDEYTAGQFSEDQDISKIVVTNNWKIVPDAFVFIERDDIPEDTDTLIIFNWHRKYAADRRFNFDLSGWKRVKKEDFKGYSHDKITMEIYKKC